MCVCMCKCWTWGWNYSNVNNFHLWDFLACEYFSYFFLACTRCTCFVLCIPQACKQGGWSCCLLALVRRQGSVVFLMYSDCVGGLFVLNALVEGGIETMSSSAANMCMCVWCV